MEVGGREASTPQQFLRDRYGAAVQRVEKLGQGQWSRAYSFDFEGRGYVVRFGAHEEDFVKDRRAVRYASAALPIPRVTEIGAVAGGFYAVSELLSGTFLDHLDAHDLRATLPSVWTMLGSLRTSDVSTTSGYGLWDATGEAPYGSWRSFLRDVVFERPWQRTTGWRRRLSALPDAEAAFLDAGKVLHALTDNTYEVRHLVHADTLNRNVLTSNHSVSGVLDWGCALYGDFLYDVAWFSFWAPWFDSLRDIDVRREALDHFASVGVAVADFEERMRACEVHIGMCHIAYSAWLGDRGDIGTVVERTVAVSTV